MGSAQISGSLWWWGGGEGSGGLCNTVKSSQLSFLSPSPRCHAVSHQSEEELKVGWFHLTRPRDMRERERGREKNGGWGWGRVKSRRGPVGSRWMRGQKVGECTRGKKRSDKNKGFHTSQSKGRRWKVFLQLFSSSIPPPSSTSQHPAPPPAIQFAETIQHGWCDFTG